MIDPIIHIVDLLIHVLTIVGHVLRVLAEIAGLSSNLILLVEVEEVHVWLSAAFQGGLNLPVPVASVPRVGQPASACQAVSSHCHGDPLHHDDPLV